MTKRFFAGICSGLLLMGLPSCKAQKENDRSLLWRISGNKLSKPSYLFGTIHMICPSEYLWTEVMKKSLAACDKVCFEMDMDDPAVLQGASEGLTDASGKSLKDYFTPQQYEHLRKFAEDSLETDLSQMQMMKPMVLEAVLMAKFVPCSFPVSYEANIMEEAGKSKKEILGLEDIREQLDLFNNIPDDSAASTLLQMADSFSTAKQEYAQMLATYRAQDLPELYRQVKASKELGDQMDAFLDDRNQKWIPRMRGKMKDYSIFFAVGAAHLYGDKGVINLLRTAGYTVTPVH